MSERIFLLLHEKDNTVTALKNLAKGEEIIFDPEEESARITLRQEIPYAHKFARVFIPRGSDVIKYGEVIGAATEDIHPGDHVHVHNVESKRARGIAS
ncbi:MAG: UxaA family hydrolase [Deltaproteobacteria bacterium]|nr:UxaA family hydrolase [Deltaproteobacteria bacterium]MBW2305680.1 UxaA family hydrolase [Deltaproteobacteria bacterium]